MSRTQLEGVVRALNARLPRRMQIGPEADFWQNDVRGPAGECDDGDGLSRMSEAEMKRRIEELVGIRTVVGKNRVSKVGLGLDRRARVPPAPKAVRTRNAAWRPYEKTPWEMELDGVGDQADNWNSMIEEALVGSSPLAGRTKSGSYSRGRSCTLSLLPILQEENEGGESKDDNSEGGEDRPSKRQRVSFGSVAEQLEQGSQVNQELGGSRLIENMDVSGSPLLDREDNASSNNFAKSDGRAATITSSPVSGATREEEVQAVLHRRRSTRIKEIGLRRASSIDIGKKTMLGAGGLKSSILRSKSFSSRRTQSNGSTLLEEPNARGNPNAPREFAIRLPFTSTPLSLKSDPPAWSAPRILRSHSQRLLKSRQSTKTKASLERSRSERYPRASDMAFVTIDRPRYRFTQRESSGMEVARRDQDSPSSMDASSARAAGQSGPQERVQIGTERSNGKHEHENEDPNGVSKNSAISDLQTGVGVFPSAFCGFLPSRSRAPSTSTVASTRSNGCDSPARMTARGGAIPTEAQISAFGDGATDCVWEALERMAVDSL